MDGRSAARVVEADLEGDRLPELGVEGSFRIGMKRVADLVLSGREKRGLLPASDEIAPALPPRALLLQDPEQQHAGAARGSFRLEGLVGAPVVDRKTRSSQRRHSVAGK